MATILETTLLDEVAAYLASMPEQQRLALIQRKYQQRGYDEIGLSLQCTETAARAAVYAALRQLRDRFGDRL